MALERVLIRPVADVRELDPAGADIAELSAIDYAGIINLGTTSATALNLGSVGVLTTILGNLQVDGTTTLVNTMSAQGDVNLGNGLDTINIGGGVAAPNSDIINLRDNLNVAAGILINLHTNGGYITLPTEVQAPAVDGTDGYLRLNVGAVPDVLEFLDLANGVWVTVAVLGGVTLDFAYDGGGAGAGRIITCDQGAVEITGSNAGDYALEVTNSGAGGVLFVNNTSTGLTIDIQDGGGNVFSIADGGAFDLDAAAFDLNATGNITIDTSAGVIDIDATGAIDIDSSAGSIGIGTTPVAMPINIGTGAAARKVTIGELTTVTEVQIDGLLVDINAGATGMTLDSVGAITVNSSAGTIGIGTIADNFGINLGTAGARTIAVGSAAALAVNIDAIIFSIDASTSSNLSVLTNSVGAETLTIAASNVGAGSNDIDMDADDIAIDAIRSMSLNVSAGAINIGNVADAQAINIGTAGVRSITVGNVAATGVQVDALLVDINAVNSATINAGAASHFIVDSADLTLQTTTSNDIVIDAFRDVLIKNATNLVATFDAAGITMAAGASIDEFSTDGTLAGNSDVAVPTEQAVKTYVDGAISGADVWLATADEAINVGDAVCGSIGVDDRVNQANADFMAPGRQYCLGFATTAAVGAGNTFNVQSFGLSAQVTCPAAEAWVRGNAIYLDDVVGQVSNVAPLGVGDVVQRVGWAAETNAVGTVRTMFIAIGEPTLV